MNRAGADARPTPRVRAALAALRDRHERVTGARQAVLEILDQTTDHLDADEIVTRAARVTPGVHRATVYRALATLGELGLVTHTHISGAAAVYHLAVKAAPDPGTAGDSGTAGDGATAGEHAHLQCTRCQTVIDVPIAVLSALADTLDRDLGFTLQPQHAALLGVCASCRS